MKRSDLTVLYMGTKQLPTLADTGRKFAGLDCLPPKTEGPQLNWIHIPSMACLWMGAYGERILWTSQLKIDGFCLTRWSLSTLAALRGLMNRKSPKEMLVWSRGVNTRNEFGHLITPPTHRMIPAICMDPTIDTPTPEMLYMSEDEREEVQHTLFALDDLCMEYTRYKFQKNIVLTLDDLETIMKDIDAIFDDEEMRHTRSGRHVVMLAEASRNSMLFETEHVIFRHHPDLRDTQYYAIRAQNTTIYQELPVNGPFFKPLPSGRVFNGLHGMKILIELVGTDLVRVSTPSGFSSLTFYSVRKAAKRIFEDVNTKVTGNNAVALIRFTNETIDINKIVDVATHTILDTRYSRLIKLVMEGRYTTEPATTEVADDTHHYALFVDGSRGRCKSTITMSPFIAEVVAEADLKKWVWNSLTRQWTLRTGGK